MMTQIIRIPERVEHDHWCDQMEIALLAYKRGDQVVLVTPQVSADAAAFVGILMGLEPGQMQSMLASPAGRLVVALGVRKISERFKVTHPSIFDAEVNGLEAQDGDHPFN